MSKICRSAIVLIFIVLLACELPQVLAESGQSTRISDPNQHHRVGEDRYPYRAKSDYILNELDLTPGDTAVDIGAGDGWWVERMAKFVGAEGTIYAAEIDANMVDKLKEQFASVPQIKPYICQPNSAALDVNSCDLVFFSQVYHHINENAQLGYLKELRSIVKPTGRLVIIEKYTETGLGHGTHGTKLSTLIAEAEEAGWVPLRIDLITGTYHYIAIFAQQKLFPPEPPKKKKPAKLLPSGHSADTLKLIQRRIAQNKAILLDVREENEWNQGHIDGAILAPLSKLQSEDKDLIEQLRDTLDKERIIYLHCRSGRRTLIAAPILEKLSYDARPLKAGYQDLIKAGFNKN
jgi:rhodanese-related sulfurtransferase/ubiquinone/menaquinone biosynthesis C-methylase UbiE